MNEIDALKQEIEALKGSLTGNMMEDMEIRDQIHNLEMKVTGTKPMDTRIDCVGCGSQNPFLQKTETLLMKGFFYVEEILNRLYSGTDG